MEEVNPDIVKLKKFIESTIAPLHKDLAEALPTEMLFPITEWIFMGPRLFGKEPVDETVRVAFIAQVGMYIRFFHLEKEILDQINLQDLMTTSFGGFLHAVRQFTPSPGQIVEAGLSFFRSLFSKGNFGLLDTFKTGEIPESYRFSTSAVKYLNSLPPTVMDYSEVVAVCDNALALSSRDDSVYNRDLIIEEVYKLLQQYPILKNMAGSFNNFYSLGWNDEDEDEKEEENNEETVSPQSDTT